MNKEEKLIAMEILKAREDRVINIMKKLGNSSSVLCLKANTPGIDKNPPYITFLLSEIEKETDNIGDFIEKSSYRSPDGPYILYSYNIPAAEIKKRAVFIEDSHTLGRLTDLDVYDGRKSISRSDLKISPRSCFICSEPAALCARSKKHTYEELQKKINSILQEYKNNK